VHDFRVKSKRNTWSYCR